MSIEDITYLKNNSIKDSYTFLIDSSDRDKMTYPEPNTYQVEFSTPFKNVIGLEVIDASIPRTMYSIDANNNVLYYYIGNDNDDIIQYGLSNITVDNEEYPDISSFTKFEMATGDYTIQTFIPRFNTVMRDAGVDIQIKSLENPPELKNLVKFVSSKPFIIEMGSSTMAETLGFDIYTQENEHVLADIPRRYRYIKKYGNNKNLRRIFHSVYSTDEIPPAHRVISPGMIYLVGNRYLTLRCPEIEQHAFRSLSYSKYNLGLAKFRINGYGYNDERLEITKAPLREFHPIGKLSKMTFRFETKNGSLYDFKGVNHNILFLIYYYKPVGDGIFKKSILNPNYKSNYIDYMYTNDEQEQVSDEENFSRDNINLYKSNEKIFNKKNIHNTNLEMMNRIDITSYKSSDDDYEGEHEYD